MESDHDDHASGSKLANGDLDACKLELTSTGAIAYFGVSVKPSDICQGKYKQYCTTAGIQ